LAQGFCSLFFVNATLSKYFFVKYAPLHAKTGKKTKNINYLLDTP